MQVQVYVQVERESGAVMGLGLLLRVPACRPASMCKCRAERILFGLFNLVFQYKYLVLCGGK